MDLTLIDLKDGESGYIRFIEDNQFPHGRRRRRGRGWGFERRLSDMGLTPGTKVTVIKSAPLNGPVEVLVRGSRLALGRNMAKRIFVKKEI